MKPLNHKERDDKFFNFVVAGTITLGITIFCFYFTYDFLTDAIYGKKVEQYARFQLYMRNQQRYTKQLDQINTSLSGNFADFSMVPKLVSDFKAGYTRSGDTSLLMKKILDLCNKNRMFIEDRNKALEKRNEVKAQLKECKEKLKLKAKRDTIP